MSAALAIETLRLGVHYANSGDKPKATELIRRALQYDAQCEMAWIWLASLSETPSESYYALCRVLEINPGNERARTGLGAARLRAAISEVRGGNKPVGLKLLRESLQAEPDHELGWMWLASASDQPDEVLTALRKVLAINPKNAQALAALEARKPRPAPGPAAQAPTPVRNAWQCPFCGHGSSIKQSTCPDCRTMQSLSSLDTLLGNNQVNASKLQPGVQRLLERSKVRPDATVHFYLAIGFLQLRAMDSAAHHFRELLKFQQHESIRQYLVQLEQRIQQPQPVSVAEEPVALSRPSSRYILIVDDSPTIRRLVGMTVTRLGLRPVEAGDGNEALTRIAEEGMPELVFLDIMMPGMDGYTLCQALRARREMADLPIVMLSGKDGKFNRMRGRTAGSSHYITKPFQPDSLVEVIQQYCLQETASTPG